MSNAQRTLTAEDLFRIVVVGNPKASPDRSRIAWVQSQADQGLDGYRSAIWVSNADGSDARKLTSGAHRDGNPQWAPDGQSIAFISNRPGTPPRANPDENEVLAKVGEGKKPGKESKDPKPLPQVWTIAVDGGEAVQRSFHANGADSPIWSPDGSQIAFVAKDDPTEEERDAAPSVVGPIADERVIQSVSYRFDGQGFLEKFSHLWTTHLDSGESRQLTHGPANDGSPAWSPDGAEIAFTSNRTADRALRWNRQAVYVVSASDGDIRQLTPDDGRLGSPAWSPDGSRLALLGHDGTGSYLLDRIWTVGADGNNLTCLTESTDLGFGDSGMGDIALGGENGPVWSGDGSLVALASQSGETQAFEISVDDGSIRPLTEGSHRVNGFAIVSDGLVVARGAINRPFELASVKRGESTLVDLTAANAELLTEVELPAAIDLPLQSADGTAIQGWIIPPANADIDSGAKHPLIIQIHGGPHAMYGYAMFHEMQLMAAKGYAVAFCNPRGSAGYGQDFLSSTRGIWGEADMPDVIALTEAASALPWIDENRLGITGGSYGGYLTNWIVGHDTRFRAAVTQRCVSSFLSFFGTSDIGTTFGVDEFGGLPWSDFELLRKHSPVSYVDRIETPLLIIHSEKDLRCPIEQAEQMYAALFYLGRDVGFIRFPEESHELSRSGTPSRRMARLHHLIGWFDQKL